MAVLTPKNWNSFQHYKDRAPAWIKLHKGLLDDFEFHRLPLASKALAPLLWLLASEYDNGEITASTEEIAFRFRLDHADLLVALKPLIDSGFFVASSSLADCKQDAIPEREREKQEKEEKRERETRAREASPKFLSPDWHPIEQDAEAGHDAGLTDEEIDRLAKRFVTYYVARGEKRADWHAQWKSWCLEEGERKPKAIPDEPASPVNWDKALAFYVKVGKWWHGIGPDPTQAGCLAPRDLLAKHGFLQTEQVA